MGRATGPGCRPGLEPLLPQPGGFEGFVVVLEDLNPHHLAPPKGVVDGPSALKRCPASPPASSLVMAYDDPRLAGIDGLDGLQDVAA
jgi:hypothetical protein